jgi:hypothetical protein
MAFTKEDIGNMALSHLGDARINNFEEVSAEAKECALWYDICRMEALEALNWNFARSRQALSVHSEAAPECTWSFRYKLPVKYLKMRWMENPFGRSKKRIPFEIELAPVDGTRTILTNLEEATAVYTRDQTNVATFSPKFITALSHLMAARMAKGLNGTDKDQRAQYQLYNHMISAAMASNANEAAQDEIADADVILARSGGTDFTPGASVNIWDVADGQN